LIDCSTGKDAGEKRSDSRAAAFQTQDYPFITITEKAERVKEKLEVTLCVFDAAEKDKLKCKKGPRFGSGALLG